MLDWKYRPKDQRESPKILPEDEREETPESFASKHVKTITFLICLGVLLALFGPVSVFHIYRSMERGEDGGSAVMTEADLLALASLGERLTMKDLTGFQGEMGENESRTTFYIYYEDYILFAVENKKTGMLDFCMLTHTDSEESIDIRKDNVRAFLEAHQKK